MCPSQSRRERTGTSVPRRKSEDQHKSTRLLGAKHGCARPDYFRVCDLRMHWIGSRFLLQDPFAGLWRGKSCESLDIRAFNIEDWGRSELNTMDKHMLLSEKAWAVFWYRLFQHLFSLLCRLPSSDLHWRSMLSGPA